MHSIIPLGKNSKCSITTLQIDFRIIVLLRLRSCMQWQCLPLTRPRMAPKGPIFFHTCVVNSASLGSIKDYCWVYRESMRVKTKAYTQESQRGNWEDRATDVRSLKSPKQRWHCEWLESGGTTVENELTLQARRPWGKKKKKWRTNHFFFKKRQIQLNVSLKDWVDYKEGKELPKTYTYFPMAIEGNI